MIAIWKYPLAETFGQDFEIPGNHKVLSLQLQNGIPTLWIMVDTEVPTIKKTIWTIETGSRMPEHLTSSRFIGTYQIGEYAYHVFQ